MAQWRVPLVAFFALLGTATSLYIIWIERQMKNLPGYVPSCDFGDNPMFSFLKGSNCSGVFKSQYAYPLSNFGILPKDHDLDFGLPVFGAPFYASLLSFPVMRKKPNSEYLYLLLGCASMVVSAYLVYVLKFILGEFCVLCATMHLCNFGSFACFVTEYQYKQKLKAAVKKAKAL